MASSTRPGAPRRSNFPRRGQLRIIGGEFRGRRLPIVERPGLRPSADRLRETVFNWLQPVLPAAAVIDVCAGSGAFAFEALSRGARSAQLIERDSEVCAVLSESIELLHVADRAELHQGDALSWLTSAGSSKRFDVAFVDPPWQAGLHEGLLRALVPHLAPSARVYVEADAAQSEPAMPRDFSLQKDIRVGRAHARLYVFAAG